MHWTLWTIGGIGIALALTACARGGGDGRVTEAGKVDVSVYNDSGKLVPVTTDKVVKTDAEWRAQLTASQYRITRQAGTEQPGTCGFLHNKEEGVYSCVACKLPLFYNETKFESGTGWPSFFGPIAKTNVAEKEDSSFGMVRTEVDCARCGSHLGHVFTDGPPPTNLRYCMNGEALTFTPVAKLAALADPAAKSPTTQPAE